MAWREAFLVQARSDRAVWEKLDTPGVEYSHRLHYLQMVSEKLAKGFLCPPGDPTPPEPSHAAFVRLLQVLKGRRDVRHQLGFPDATIFRRYIDSLLVMAAEIEKLAPATAGFSHPNPEYPWEDADSGQVMAPARYAFPEFDPRKPRMQKFDLLIRALLRITV